MNNHYNEKKFIILLTIPFDEIKNFIKKDNDEYKWENVKPLFEKILEDINSGNIKTFFYKYNLLKLYFIYYTNYLEFINHEDNLNIDIDNFSDKIKYSEEIISKIINISDNNLIISKIIKKINPFNINKNINNPVNFIKTCKQYEKIQLVNYDNYKKILNLIIYRYLLVKNSKFDNFNDFYMKNLYKKEDYFDERFLNVNKFIKIIPQLKSIIDLKINSTIKNDLNINYIDILKYFIKINDKNDYYIEDITDNSFVLINKKIGKILFEKSDDLNELFTFQYKLDVFYFNSNDKELKDYNFLKKSKNFFKIKYENNIINNLSSLLNIFYILTKAFKLLDYDVSDIYELIFINNINNLNYLTFYNFINYMNIYIPFNDSVQKFLIDLIKYLYIYSYYDYYFYNNKDLMNTIIDNKESKNEIFLDLCDSIKKLFKLPNELLSFPPFIKNYIFDNILYYNYDEPNYLKFYDLIMAIKNLINFDNLSINNFSSDDILSLIFKLIKIDDDSDDDINLSGIKLINKSTDENIDNKNIDNKNIDNKNFNTFVELNIENSENYQLNTDV
jgi:hypothetical protein